MKGLAAYKTYLGMMLHFKGNVDGWQYNFTGKVSPEKFSSNTRLMYMYAAIERDFPTKLDQIRFFYPAFRIYGYVKPDAVMLMRKAHRAHMKYFDDPAKSFGEEMTQLYNDGKVCDVNDLYECEGLILNICQLKLSQNMSALLFVLFPTLNTVVSKEPIVFESWKSKVLVDMKFIQLYISQPQLQGLKDATVAAIQHMMNQNSAAH